MKILAIDQSSKKVGIAFFNNGMLEHSDHAEIEPAEDFYMKFYNMLMFMWNQCDTWKPDIVFTEDPQSLSRVNPKICRLLTITLSAMIYACWNRGIQLEILSPSQIKKVMTGKGNAKKDQVREAVNKKFNLQVESEDEADAIAIGFTWFSIT